MKSHAPLLLLGIMLILILGVFGIVRVMAGPELNPEHACTTEALICPDGTAVGRTEPQCEFAACPPQATSTAQLEVQAPASSSTTTQVPQKTTQTTATVSLGQSASLLADSVVPREVSEDSRCPEGVQCVWAGTVKVKATLKSAMGESEVVFGLGTPITTEDAEITLTSVTPVKKEGTVAPALYRFTFDARPL